MLARPEFVSLYEAITRRIRSLDTIFGQNVKLVLRQLDEEHWSLLPLPYLLVVPTVSRPEPVRGDFDEIDVLVVPHSVTLIAQLDARGSEAEYLAAADVELAEKQLILALVNWRPGPCYGITTYGGMRLAGSRLPDVKCSYVFMFTEQIALPDQIVGDELVELDKIIVAFSADCCPVDYSEVPGGVVPPICVTPNRRF